MIGYLTDFYGPVGGIVVFWIICACLGFVIGTTIKIMRERGKK